MRLHPNTQVRVAGWPSICAGRPLSRQTDPLVVLYTGRDLHRETPWRLAVLPRDLDDVLGALVCLGQGHLDLALDIFALSGARSRPRTPATEQVVGVREATVTSLAEERPEEIGEPARVVAEGALAGLPGVHVLEAAGPGGASAPLRELLPLRADRVVSLSLVGIAEDLVGLVDLFELFLRVRLLVDVRVVLACELAVRLLDVLGRGVLRNAEGLVVVLVLDRHPLRPRN